MIEEFDRVRIISLEKTGIVVDIRNTTKKFYLVELDNDNSLFDCTEQDIVLAVPRKTMHRPPQQRNKG